VRLPERSAVITGGGSGIGRATAVLFAREGARVVIADRDERGGQETEAMIVNAGGQARFIPTDVTRAADVQVMLDLAVREFGGVDVLFNNAGLAMSFTPIEQVPESLLDAILEVNVKGVFLGCQLVAPIMKRQGRGVILNMGSTAGIRPRPGLSAYNMSKGAVITLTKSLALELAPYKIRVVSICPVATDTPMLPTFIGDQVDPEEGRRRFIATIPLGRLNTPDDLARAALWLASDEAEMVTGTAFEVDGGRDV
jgi:3-oxoacyl-[acyl-carrier protein] reductase